MKKGFIICSIVASSLVLLGILLFLGVLLSVKGEFGMFGNARLETNTYEITDDFDSVSLKTDTADVVFLVSEDGICRVVCYERESMGHAVTVEEGTLSVQLEDTRKWYEHISLFSVGHPMITVYLPEREYVDLSVKVSTGDVELPAQMGFERIEVLGTTGDVNCSASARESVKIKTTTGAICVENVSAGQMGLQVSTGKMTVSGVSCDGDLSVSVSTGKSYLTDIACKNLYSTGNTGDISLKNVIASETFSIERSTGDVTLEECDAAELFLRTDTGDVEGSLCSEKIFMVMTDTGDIDVPKTVTGGRCEVTTDTGDIKITVH